MKCFHHNFWPKQWRKQNIATELKASAFRQCQIFVYNYTCLLLTSLIIEVVFRGNKYLMWNFEIIVDMDLQLQSQPGQARFVPGEQEVSSGAPHFYDSHSGNSNTKINQKAPHLLIHYMQV